MLPADYPFELRQRIPPVWGLHLLRIMGLAVSLALHLGVLLYLLTPVAPMPHQARYPSAVTSSLQVVLLDPAPRVVAVESVETLPEPGPQAPAAPVPVLRPASPVAAPARSAAPVAQDAPVSAARLFGGIEGAARDLTASDRPLAGAGMPSARARLPGSSEAIVDLPVRFKRRPTPQQVTNFLAKIVIGTMAGHPDDFESATEMRNPLRDLTDAHIGTLREPECNDPDDPLRDPRCLERPQR